MIRSRMAQLSSLLVSRSSYFSVSYRCGTRQPGRHTLLDGCGRASNSTVAQLHFGDIGPSGDAILQYWFGPDYLQTPATASPDKQLMKKWYAGTPDVDKEIVDLFGKDLERAQAGEFDSYNQGYNALAALILMDQFTRNAYRGSAKMYSLDAKACKLARSLLGSGKAVRFPPVHRHYIFSPLMHSEDPADTQAAVDLEQTMLDEVLAMPDAEEGLKDFIRRSIQYWVDHNTIVQKWGRYPHRNAFLRRPSTPEEEEGLRNGSIPTW